MTQLSNTQALILSAASQRDGHIALPLPAHLRGGAATKVVQTLITKGFLEEVDADLRKGEPVWRETGDGHGVTLVATDAGLATIGVEVESAVAEPINEAVPKTCTPTEPVPKARTVREGTKQAQLIAMLSAPDGATIAEIATALAWAPHTCRGALSGALKKRLGLTITSQTDAQRGRVYRIEDATL
jgi:hypothetical protein